MKILVTILLLANIYSFSCAQTFSLEIDSLTTAYINRLSKKEAVKFDSILVYRKSIGLFNRIDTLPFDYAFIEESVEYDDTSLYATTIYFSPGDSITKYPYYYQGKPDTIIHKLSEFASYSKLKPVQTLPYDKEQVWAHGCVAGEDEYREFVESVTDMIKSTYQIQTMIDKKNQKVIVSIQLPPKRPKFKVRSWNQAWF